MYFKKLELIGFKSFAEKTTLHFEPGITAVVGPNGCGKSNVFDSIRWVLGEQSVKSLRGSKMEDVIFNGTENIPALGYAEVSLSFANETKALPIDYDEVTVTRRLYRSGESEYLINKSQVRLKDILELFMGTGIGAESYSLIEQGKIDLILSSRPEDRRLVFDEAAGISKYKSQKKETLRKLEDTEANLLRSSDIITEVKRQINSLERQAAKAKRYKEVFDRLRELETALAADQIKQHQDRMASLQAQLEQLITQENQDAQSLEQLNQEFIAKQQELNGLEDTLGSLRSQGFTIENNISQAIQQLNFNRERIEWLKNRLEIIAAQKEELSLKIIQDQETIGDLQANLNNLIKELEEKKTGESKSNQELVTLSNQIQQIQQNLKIDKAKVLEYAANEASARNQLQKFTSQLNQAVARKKRLDIEKIKAEEELTVINNDLKNAQETEDAAYNKFTRQKDEYGRFKTELTNIIQDKEAFNIKLQNLENELAALESQREFLGNLKLRYENIAESSSAVLLLDSLASPQISGIILKVEEVQNPSDTDLAAYNQSKYKIKGIAKPISLDPQEIVNKIEGINQEIARARDELNQKIQLISALEDKLNSAQNCLRESEIEYNTCKNKKDNILTLAGKLKEELEIVLSEAGEIEAELSKLGQEERILNESLLKIKEEAEDNLRAIEGYAEEISAKNSARENILVTFTQLKTEISAVAEKISGYEETQKNLLQTFSKDQASLEALIQEDSGSKGRSLELEEEIVKLDSKIETAQKQKAVLEEEITRTSSLLQEAKDKLTGLQNAISQRKDILDANKARIYELRAQSQEVTFLQNSLYERMRQVYKIGPDELKNNSKEGLNLEENAHEVQTLKQKIESYGQVNLVAIEEFDELRQRFDFLTNQQQDLIKAKEALHEAILKINRTTRKMFLETFEKLAEEFKNYFRLLFGGGEARLFLLDEHDVLESGIEIVCRPPGKKLQNVLLLSGGEKSMSAIALLFAIFKVKPSPFCVLDEIDAALDESNVDRFSRMLVDFTSQSQFIVITHNKKTIANANIMYGITMEKAGISKIVSVKLADKKETPPPQRPAEESLTTTSQ